jgi:hypothetical protein
MVPWTSEEMAVGALGFLSRDDQGTAALKHAEECFAYLHLDK